eukprot:Lankesteria_metandrocarpae@DN4814_c0_g1_i1.p1
MPPFSNKNRSAANSCGNDAPAATEIPNYLYVSAPDPRDDLTLTASPNRQQHGVVHQPLVDEFYLPPTRDIYLSPRSVPKYCDTDAAINGSTQQRHTTSPRTPQEDEQAATSEQHVGRRIRPWHEQHRQTRQRPQRVHNNHVHKNYASGSTYAVAPDPVDLKLSNIDTPTTTTPFMINSPSVSSSRQQSSPDVNSYGPDGTSTVLHSEISKYGADNDSSGSATSTTGTAASTWSAISTEIAVTPNATLTNRPSKVCKNNHTTGNATLPIMDCASKRSATVDNPSPQISFVVGSNNLLKRLSQGSINTFSPSFKPICSGTGTGSSATGVCGITGTLAGSSASPVILKRHKWLIQEELSLVRSIAEVPHDEDIRSLIDALGLYVQEYRETTCDPFWRRKSGKTVLAVVMIRWQNKLQFFRGINSEISLPAGSNCAERAAISAALSSHLGITRGHFEAVAVVDPDVGSNNMNPISPCGVCEEWLKKIQEKSSSFTVLAFGSADLNLVIQRYPVLFVEERKLDKKPAQLSSIWQCRCGFEFNLPKLSRCSKCDQSRYKFKPEVQRCRVLVLNCIKILSNDVVFCTMMNIAKWTRMRSSQINHILSHLQSLKFVVSETKVELQSRTVKTDDYSSGDHIDEY